MSNRYSLKIGLIEFQLEGDADFIQQERLFFVKNILPFHQGKLPENQATELVHKKAEEQNLITQETKKETRNKTKTTNKVEHYQTVEISADKDKRQLIIGEFHKMPNTKSIQRNILSLIYLLRKHTNTTSVTPDIVYTLLKLVNLRVPKSISQSLRDLRSKNGSITRNEDGTFTINHIGENIVEHDVMNLS